MPRPTHSRASNSSRKKRPLHGARSNTGNAAAMVPTTHAGRYHTATPQPISTLHTSTGKAGNMDAQKTAGTTHATSATPGLAGEAGPGTTATVTGSVRTGADEANARSVGSSCCNRRTTSPLAMHANSTLVGSGCPPLINSLPASSPAESTSARAMAQRGERRWAQTRTPTGTYEKPTAVTLTNARTSEVK